MSAFRNVPPFSNHSEIPLPLRVLVAQTPFLAQDAISRPRPLLAHIDLTTTSKVAPVPTSMPIIYTMENVVKEAQAVQELAPNYLSPSIAPTRGSPFPESNYVTFQAFHIQKQDAQLPSHPAGAGARQPAGLQHIPILPTATNTARMPKGAPSSSDTAAQARAPRPAAVKVATGKFGNAMVHKPGGVHSMTAEHVADAWGHKDEVYQELKVLYESPLAQCQN